MPATEQSVDTHAVELDQFFGRATRELQSAVALISVYAALLDAQLAEDQSLSNLRPVVRNVRAQAELVAALVDGALTAWI
jgi:light-regulated signal transduction histidine kinase (bacteriophytochrome)